MATFRSVVKFNKKVTHKVHHLRLKLVEPREINFTAGQFISVKASKDLRRNYSIASSPTDKKFVDLINDISPGGPGSVLFEKSKKGDEVEFLGPLGLFRYKENAKRHAIFISTGTGISPLFSMINEAVRLHKTERQLTLIQGFRHEEDIFFSEELNKLERKYKNLDVYRTLSRPKENWKGLRGRVTKIIDEKVPKDKQMDVYICGSQGMIASVEELFLERGVDAENIHYEKFY